MYRHAEYPIGTLYGTELSTYTNYVDSHIGNDVKDWQTKALKGLDASSNYSMREFKVIQPHHWKVRRYMGSQGYMISEGKSLLNFVPPTALFTDASLDDIALKRLKRKIQTDEGQFSSLVPLAEIKETRQLIGQVVNATTEVVKSLIEIKRGKYKDVLKAASDAWLTFSFGVSPTLSDINSALNSIDSYLSREVRFTRYSGSAEKTTDTITCPTNYGPAYAGYLFEIEQHQRVKIKYKYTAGIRVDLKSVNNYGIDEHFGLSFGELPSVAWELTPFSWIVDYFTTTGDFLSDAFWAPQGNTIYVTRSISNEFMLDSRIKRWTCPATYNPSFEINEPLRVQGVGYDRQSIGQLPHRAWRLKSIDEIATNSVNRLLNLTALLVR